MKQCKVDTNGIFTLLRYVDINTWTPLNTTELESEETKNNTFSLQSKLSQVVGWISLALNIPTMQKDQSICHHQNSSFKQIEAWSTTWAAWTTSTYISGKIFSNYFSDIKENISRGENIMKSGQNRGCVYFGLDDSHTLLAVIEMSGFMAELITNSRNLL